uniref:cytochrome-c oxidase n=1 Tax=Diplonema japonicum TaxID=2508216 RepID=A0A6G5ZTN1_9EUGL|nr:cytochrome c oxidase subunit 2 [Diplonema japonicum]
MLLHNLAMIYSTHAMLEATNLAIVVFIASGAMHVLCILSRALYTMNLYVELVWLLVPTAVVILLIARVVLLQCAEEDVALHSTQLSVVANQWYWVYGLDATTLFLYTVREQDLECGDLRLLHTTQLLVADSSTSLLLILSSADVIHSWALPSLGMKVDCVPGRANSTSLACTHSGVLYGQCSEICGSLHGFMPLVVAWF